MKTLDWINDGNIFLVHDDILLLYHFDKMQTESANILNLKIEKIQSSHDKNELGYRCLNSQITVKNLPGK